MGQKFEFNGYRANVNVEKETFMRDFLTGLAEEKTTPTDIFTSQFEKVELLEKDFILAKADVKLSYAADIGYDRKVSIGGETKTVTDWTPISGTHEGEEAVIEYNGDFDYNNFDRRQVGKDDFRNLLYGESWVAKSISCAEIEQFSEEEENEFAHKVNEKAYCRAMDRAIKKCSLGINYPGDRVNNQTYSGYAKIHSISMYRLPVYRVKYKYQGKEYWAEGYACTKNAEKGTTVKCVKTFPSDSSNVQKKAMSLAVWFMLAAIIPLVLAIVNGTQANVSGMVTGIVWTVGLLLLGLIVFLVRKSTIYSSQKEEKMNNLKACMKKLGIKE